MARCDGTFRFTVSFHTQPLNMKEKLISKDSIVKQNTIKDPNYNPYCGRCSGLIRMIKIEVLYWKCKQCGAEHDEREQNSDPYYTKQD